MKKKKKNLPQIRKDIKTFLTSEEGKITKRGIITGGLTLTMLGIALDSSFAHGSHGNDWSYIHNAGVTGYHSSHDSHGSHGSHASW